MTSRLLRRHGSTPPATTTLAARTETKTVFGQLAFKLKGRSVVSLRPFSFALLNLIGLARSGGRVICDQITTACSNTRFTL
jgi:hypothetical protein